MPVSSLPDTGAKRQVPAAGHLARLPDPSEGPARRRVSSRRARHATMRVSGGRECRSWWVRTLTHARVAVRVNRTPAA